MYIPVMCVCVHAFSDEQLVFIKCQTKFTKRDITFKFSSCDIIASICCYIIIIENYSKHFYFIVSRYNVTLSAHCTYLIYILQVSL